MAERFLVTGVLGCLGAWVARTLVREGAEVVGLDVGTDPRRLREIMAANELERVALVQGDITRAEDLGRVLDDHEITSVIHLAALQIPFCRENPALGAAVNVLGTVNVFEAVKQRRERIAGPLVYASSAAYFGPDDAARALEREDALSRPVTHYGVYKQANEGNARIYWQDEGLSSVGLRPFIVYGPARDQGITAAPTLATRAAVLGDGYHIAFGGRLTFNYAEDVAAGAHRHESLRLRGSGCVQHARPDRPPARDRGRNRGGGPGVVRHDHVRRRPAPVVARDGGRWARGGDRPGGRHAGGGRGARHGGALPAPAVSVIVLRSPELLVRLDPSHGGEMLDLVDLRTGRQLLGRPPFGSEQPLGGDLDETAWTARYRGGWQLALPNAGTACEVGGSYHGFHGRASIDPWQVRAAGGSRCVLEWSGHGLRVLRTFELAGGGVTVHVEARAVEERVPLVAVEHLAVGLELLEPEVEIELPGGHALRALGGGRAAESRRQMPAPGRKRGSSTGRCERCDRWPLERPRSRLLVVAELPEGRATVRNPSRGQGLELVWDADWLRHCWLWHEARIYGGPWRGQAEILAIEPASVPHSLGLAAAIEHGQARWLERGENRLPTDSPYGPALRVGARVPADRPRAPEGLGRAQASTSARTAGIALTANASCSPAPLATRPATSGPSAKPTSPESRNTPAAVPSAPRGARSESIALGATPPIPETTASAATASARTTGSPAKPRSAVTSAVPASAGTSTSLRPCLSAAAPAG